MTVKYLYTYIIILKLDKLLNFNNWVKLHTQSNFLKIKLLVSLKKNLVSFCVISF